MSTEKFYQHLEDFKRALSRLREVLALPLNDVVRDSAIQRFEFTMDIAWKTLKVFLFAMHGITVKSPKEAFRQAYKTGIIPYDEFWMELIDMRNTTAHAYNEQYAQTVYAKLPKAVEKFNVLLQALEHQQ